MKSYGFRLLPHEHEKMLALGGVNWIREQVRKAPWPAQQLFIDHVARDQAIVKDFRPCSVVAKIYGISTGRVYKIRESAKNRGWEVTPLERTTVAKLKPLTAEEQFIANDFRSSAEVAEQYGITVKRVQAIRRKKKVRQQKGML